MADETKLSTADLFEPGGQLKDMAFDDDYLKLLPGALARAQWDDYREAYNEMLRRCTTDHAPWYVIPADQKWYRNLAIARVVVDALERLNPQYPDPPENLDQYVIE